MHRRFVGVMAALALAASACGGADTTADTGGDTTLALASSTAGPAETTSTIRPATSAPPSSTTTPPSTEAPSTTEAPAAGDGDVTTTTSAPGVKTIVDRQWQVVGVVELDVVQPPPGDAPVTLVIHDGRVSGSAGCNEYSATALVDGDSLSVGSIAITERACADAVDWAAMLETLAAATRFEMTDGTLIIHAGPDRALVLE